MKRLLPLIVLIASTGCGSLKSHDEVILLPGKDGKVGAVSVNSGKGEAILNTPYASAKTGDDSIITGVSSADEINRDFGDALAMQPPRPASFLVYFETGSDRLTNESGRAIDGILADIAKRPSPEVVVIGHTDTVGRVGIRNDELSRQRAEVVRTMLVGRGIPATSISVEGRGSRELLAPTANNVDEPRNRRVEIIVR